jgi:hypothetical protein
MLSVSSTFVPPAAGEAVVTDTIFTAVCPVSAYENVFAEFVNGPSLLKNSTSTLPYP